MFHDFTNFYYSQILLTFQNAKNPGNHKEEVGRISKVCIYLTCIWNHSDKSWPNTSVECFELTFLVEEEGKEFYLKEEVPLQM